MWPATTEPLLQQALAPWADRALAAGLQLGVFAELGKGPRTARHLAGACGLAPASARDLLDALLALAWIERDGDDAQALYLNTRLGAAFLDGRSPACLGDRLWPRPLSHGDVGQRLRAGPAEAAGDERPALRRLREGLGALHGQALARCLGLPAGGAVLDLHGPGGLLAAGWALHAHSALPVLSLQRPADVAAAAAGVQAQGLATQVTVQADDPRHRPPPHDTVLLSLALDDAARAERRRRLARGRAALAPGGRLLIVDHLADDTRRGPAPALVWGLALRLLGGTRGALAESDLRADCEHAALQVQRLCALPGGARVLVAGHAAG